MIQRQSKIRFLLLAMLVSMIGLLGTRHSRLTTAIVTTPISYIFLPIIIGLPEPPELIPSQEVLLQVAPNGHLLASSFDPSAFRLFNLAGNNQNITSLTIDLRTAIFPDMVFDPHGVAGDVVAKDLMIDANREETGFTYHTYSHYHHDGYDVITLYFNDFNPGESIFFSVDIDPTSIRSSQAPGPYSSGSVSGLELAGATITATLSDGTPLVGNLYRVPDSEGGGQVLLRQGLAPAPTLSAEGIEGQAAYVTSAEQFIHIQAAPYQEIVLLAVEGGLFTYSVPGGGFDIEPFEANTALTVREFHGVTDYIGRLTIPVMLDMTHPNGGINIFTAVVKDYYSYLGHTAPSLTLQLIPAD